MAFKQIMPALDYFAEYDKEQPRELVCWALDDSGSVQGLVLSEDGTLVVSAVAIKGFKEYQIRRGNQKP